MIDPAVRLPPETFALVLTYLSPPNLVRCGRVCKAWRVLTQDESLWRYQLRLYGYDQADREHEESSTGIIVVSGAIQHHADRLAQTESEGRDVHLQKLLKRYRSRNLTSFFDECDTYQSLCCKLWILESRWMGRNKDDSEPSLWPIGDDDPPDPLRRAALFPRRRMVNLQKEGSGVWRFKLDPEERTIITTGQSGGIQVFDHDTRQLLWHIPRTATRACPHLEFSKGWMIFDRPGLGHFEVWRRESLVPDLNRPPDRGHFQRFAILSSARPIRAYRFQWPFLGAASQDGFIMIWDVPKQEVVETIDMRRSPHRDGNITYIDFDDEFVFLLGMGAKSVSVFSRSTGQMVWTMGQHFNEGGVRPTTFVPESTEHDADAGFSHKYLRRGSPSLWQEGPNSMNLAQLTMTPYQIWSAVHPDLKTKTLLILGQGTVLLLRDYKQFFRDTKKPPALFMEIEFRNLRDYYESRFSGSPEISGLGWNNRMLWEMLPDAQMTVHEGKAVVVNDFPMIIDLEKPIQCHGPDHTMQEDSPPITFWSVLWNKHPQREDYHRDDLSYACSCVQMDEAGVYYTAEYNSLWDEEALPAGASNNDTHRILRHLDFAR